VILYCYWLGFGKLWRELRNETGHRHSPKRKSSCKWFSVLFQFPVVDVDRFCCTSTKYY